MQIGDLAKNPEFQELSDDAKSIVINRVAQDDEGFRTLSPQAQAIVRRRLIDMRMPSGPVSKFIHREFVEPYTEYGKRVGERLAEAGQAVLSVPSTIKQAYTGEKPLVEAGKELLHAAGAPFEPIFAPVGEAAKLWAERITGSPVAGQIAGAGTELGMGAALPFVKTPPTPGFAGLSKVGFGRVPEEISQAERAARGVPLLESFPKEIPKPEHLKAPVTREIPLEGAIPEPTTQSRPQQPTVVQYPSLVDTSAFKPGTPVNFGPDARGTVSRILSPDSLVVRRADGSEIVVTATRRIPFVPAPEHQLRGGGPVRTTPTLEKPAEPIGDELPPLVEMIVTQRVHRKVVDAAEQVLTSAGATWDKERYPLVSDQIVELLNTGKLEFPRMAEILKGNNVSLTEFSSTFFRGGVRDAARRLNALSRLVQNLKGMADKSPEAAEALSELATVSRELDEATKGQAWWRRVDNIRRGLLVTQLATAARNFETQVGRLGLDVLQQGLDAGLQRAFAKVKPGMEVTTDPLDGLETIMRFFQRGNKGKVEQILHAFPREHDRMFGIYASDIAKKTRQYGVEGIGEQAFQSAEQAVDVLNTLNRAQEFIIRRAVFGAKLDQILRNKGLDGIEEIIKQGKVGTLDQKDIRKAVNTALEFTWAKSPEYGTWAYDFVRFINRTPGATLAIPFPRFMANSMKFLFEFSPVGPLKFLSPKERAAFAAGDTKVMSRAILGSGMLLTAYQIRDSEYAGEKWYEVKVGGKTVDIRPFNPFAAYMFMADILKRRRDGTLMNLSGWDVAQGIASTNLRAGAGLYLLDQAFNLMSSTGDAEKLSQKGKAFAGEVAGGFLVPLGQITDALAQFDQTMRVVRERRTEPFLGPLKARIPGLAETLPEAESPTRAGPIMREQPLLRQLTGTIVTQEKNPIERELDRLGFRRNEVLVSSGNPEFDRLTAKAMGPVVERLMVPIVESTQYKAIKSDAAKGIVLRELLSRIGTAARRQAAGEAPDIYAQIRLHDLPPRIRTLIQEIQRNQKPTPLTEQTVPSIIQQAIGQQP